jgi:hypothetical protein
VQCATIWHFAFGRRWATVGAPLIHNNYYTSGMDSIDTLFARTHWLSDPDFSTPAFLERRAAARRGRADAHADLHGLSLVTGGPAPVRATVASTTDELAAAASLVASRYAWRGYALQPCDSTTALTVVATQSAETVGTLTLRADGPAGLAADECYRDVTDRIRAAGRRMCELTRLAIEVDAAWRPTLGALIGLAYLVGRAVHDVTDVFVEVNPRHVRFYQRMFGFVAAGGLQVCPRVAAPAVLLRLELDRFDAVVRRVGGWNPVYTYTRAAA